MELRIGMYRLRSIVSLISEGWTVEVNELTGKATGYLRSPRGPFYVHRGHTVVAITELVHLHQHTWGEYYWAPTEEWCILTPGSMEAYICI